MPQRFTEKHAAQVGKQFAKTLCFAIEKWKDEEPSVGLASRINREARVTAASLGHTSPIRFVFSQVSKEFLYNVVPTSTYFKKEKAHEHA